MMEDLITKRCAWAESSQQYCDYRDKEWGIPLHDDRKLFEMLILEGAQAGLSWSLILKKRAGYRKAFDDFDASKIAQYDENKVQELLVNSEIVRNRLKIRATLQNARAFLEIQAATGSFDTFIWQFVEGQPQQNNWQNLQELPARTTVSDAMSKALKQRGFTFVGTTICYAFMQATGQVNDHIVDCFRWQEVRDLSSI